MKVLVDTIVKFVFRNDCVWTNCCEILMDEASEYLCGHLVIVIYKFGGRASSLRCCDASIPLNFNSAAVKDW